MQKRLLNYAFMGICTVGVTGLYSCVDNAYDLNKEIDKTITVGGDLTVPGSSTEEMFLKDILDLGDDSAVKANENGDYSIVQTGNPSNSVVKVDKVNISGDNIKFDSKGISLEFVPNIGSEVTAPITDCKITINISQNDINEEIKDIDYAIIAKETPTTLTFSLSDKSSDGTFKVKKDTKFEFPQYMTVSTDDDFCTVENGNVIKFTDDVTFINGNLPVNFYIEKITFGGENAKFENNTINLTGEVSIDGNISYNGTGTTTGITLTPDIACDNIDIKSAKAIVNPKIDIDIDPIEINNLPDFLNEEGVVFDATDPRIFLTVSNNSPLDANVNMSIVAEKKGAECGKADISDIVIPGNVENHVICIHKNKDMEVPDVVNVYCENLSDVIKNIPDKIRIENIVANVYEQFYDIEIGTDFTISNSYEVNTPLMFGTETNIEYTENIDGFSEDLEDAEFSQIEMTMKAINKIPMNLVLSAEAIDKNGNAIDNVTINTTGNIEASNGTDATEKEVSFIIKAKDGSTIKNFDGLKLKVTGTATEATKNVSLNENQSLKLDNLKLKVVGGITMDLN